MHVAALTPEHAAAWVALFEACGSACFCRYWHFEGTRHEWLARCAESPERSRDEQLSLLAGPEPSPDARGLVALDGDAAAIGWLKLAPRTRLDKLRRQGAYRALPLMQPASDPGVWSVACLLVHPGHRRRGVARELVRAADEHVRSWGGKVLEAYPRRASHPLHDEEAWMGPEAMFLALGYAAAHDVAPYPVLRKTL